MLVSYQLDLLLYMCEHFKQIYFTYFFFLQNGKEKKFYFFKHARTHTTICVGCESRWFHCFACDFLLFSVNSICVQKCVVSVYLCLIWFPSTLFPLMVAHDSLWFSLAPVPASACLHMKQHWYYTFYVASLCLFRSLCLSHSLALSLSLSLAFASSFLSLLLRHSSSSIFSLSSSIPALS